MTESEYRIDPTIAYDVIELPSQGIYYPNKKKSIRVAYLTAPDEDILSSTNLISQNRVIPEILRRKILDKDISVDDLVEEDRQAILIFLRNTAYGGEYRLKLKDPKTNKEFETSVDLTTLKTKEFTLIEDSNGEYDFYLPLSKVNIKFKFLSKKQEDEIDLIRTTWKESNEAPIKTKQLEMMIKSVDGNRDPMQIHGFINKMPIKDSQDFRKFIENNKPGLDLNVNVITPSKEEINVQIIFGVEFFRPFYGV
jgi:hypothetical protein